MSPQAEPKTLGPGEHHFLLDGPAGKIECLLAIPDEADFSRVALICHPHPLYGGTMHNKVVTMCAKSCTELNIPSLRFQFRGVGASTGTHDNGASEVEDVFVLANWLKARFARANLLLLGFSFGAYVASKATEALAPTLLVAIAPAVHHHDYAGIIDVHCPWHVIMGDKDEVVPPDQVFNWFSNHQAKVNAPLELHRFKDTSHFFHGKLIDLKMKLMQILSAEA